MNVKVSKLVCKISWQKFHEYFYVIFTENKRKVEMIEQLKASGYRSDPVKAWKAETSDEELDEERGEEETGGKGQPDYNYLLSMQLWSLTRERKEELLRNRDKKVCTINHRQ